MEEAKKEGFFTRLWKGIKYKARKTLIAIYHNPYSVVLLLSAVSMMYFTMNFQKVAFEFTDGLLSRMSNGFLVFLWTLSAYLSVISYLFYSGKKKNWLMFWVFLVLMVAQLYSAIYYLNEGTALLAERLVQDTGITQDRIDSAYAALTIFKISIILISLVVVSSIAVIYLDKMFIKQRKAKYEARKAARLQSTK